MDLTITFNDLPKVEQEITELYSCGLTKKEIAALRGRSIYTVDNQLRNVFAKTKTRKDTELAAWYFCTRYGITFDLPEQVKRILAICLLALVGLNIVTEVAVIRNFRTSKTARSARTSRGRKEKKENDFIYKA